MIYCIYIFGYLKYILLLKFNYDRIYFNLLDKCFERLNEYKKCLEILYIENYWLSFYFCFYRFYWY